MSYCFSSWFSQSITRRFHTNRLT